MPTHRGPLEDELGKPSALKHMIDALYVRRSDAGYVESIEAALLTKSRRWSHDNAATIATRRHVINLDTRNRLPSLLPRDITPSFNKACQWLHRFGRNEWVSRLSGPGPRFSSVRRQCIVPDIMAENGGF
jgi:hypothetical protein